MPAARYARPAAAAVLGALLVLSGVAVLVGEPSRTALWQAMIAVSIVGGLVTAFERPVKRLDTGVHGWNFVWIVVLAIVLLQSLNEATVTTPNPVVGCLAVGAAGNAICAVWALILAVGGIRKGPNVILCVVSVLIAAAAAALAAASAANSLPVFRASAVVLFAAAAASLLGSAATLRAPSP